MKLVTNAYRICLSNNNSTIHAYQLSITPSKGSPDITAKLMRKNHVSRSIRRLVVEKLTTDLLNTNKPGAFLVVDPYLNNLYSLRRLGKSDDRGGPEGRSSGYEFQFRYLEVRTDLLELIRLDIIIKYTRSFPLRIDESGVDLMTSVLHHELLLKMLKFGSVYYKPLSGDHILQGNRLDLISQEIMGISLSGLRKCVGDETIVVLNCPHAYITYSHRLIDLLATFILGYAVRGLPLDHSRIDVSSLTSRMPEILSIRGSEDWFTSFSSILSGFKCQTIGSCVNLRFTLTNEPASDLSMMDETSGIAISVPDFYRQKGLNLNYPNLPCLKSSSTDQPYYPIELCSLLPNQKVPIFRLSSTARNHLTLLNKRKPDVSKKVTAETREKLVQLSHSQLKNFGIELSKEPVDATGITLQRPFLQYRNSVVIPQRDSWESRVFPRAMSLAGNWCVVNTVPVSARHEEAFFYQFSQYCERFGFTLQEPHFINKTKQDILGDVGSMDSLIDECMRLTCKKLKFVMFVIDSTSTSLNRVIHLSFDENPDLTATCLRVESIMNQRQHRSIYRTLVHKLNTRLGGTNVTYTNRTQERLSLAFDDLMIIGLDVTHPDNELTGVSIVGCAYTFTRDLFKHRSLVWPQAARVEMIGRMSELMERLLIEYQTENRGKLPGQIIVYRDGVSHEEFDRVRETEVAKAQSVLERTAIDKNQPKPILSYVIAQKRHTMRFFQVLSNNVVANPPGGTLIDRDVVVKNDREFYLYSNTSPQATARPLHYHVLLNGLGIENLQKLTYFLCFNFGKCSSTLSMPSSLRYAHNAAYDARNRVIAAREFSGNRFYPTKFFC